VRLRGVPLQSAPPAPRRGVPPWLAVEWQAAEGKARLCRRLVAPPRGAEWSRQRPVAVVVVAAAAVVVVVVAVVVAVGAVVAVVPGMAARRQRHAEGKSRPAPLRWSGVQAEERP